MVKVPDIYDYLDYREFLYDYKELNSFKFDDLAEKIANFTNIEGYSLQKYEDMVKGRRTIGPKYLNAFVHLHNLDNDEANYFKLLIKYNRDKNKKKKQEYYEKLLHLTKNKEKLIHKEAFEFYSNWYHSAVRALLDIIDFKDDYALIVNKLNNRINKKQAKDSISLLKKLDFIYTDNNGYLRPKDNVITKDKKFAPEGDLKSHIQRCDILKNILTDQIPGTYQIENNIMSLSSDTLELIRERIENFNKDIKKIIQKNDSVGSKRNAVYNLSVSIARLSKKEL